MNSSRLPPGTQKGGFFLSWDRNDPQSRAMTYYGSVYIPRNTLCLVSTRLGRTLSAPLLTNAPLLACVWAPQFPTGSYVIFVSPLAPLCTSIVAVILCHPSVYFTLCPLYIRPVQSTGHHHHHCTTMFPTCATPGPLC